MNTTPGSLHARDFFLDSRLKLRILERNPQIPFPLHAHDFAELVIILEGTGIHFTDGADYRVFPGDVFLIESGYSHGYRDIDNLRLYNIMFAPEILTPLFLDITSMPGYHAVFKLEPRYRAEHAFSSRLRLNPDQLHYARTLVARIRTELDTGPANTGSRALALAGLVELIVFLSRIYTQSLPTGSEQILQMADVLASMETNLHRPLSIDELAAEARMSPSTLNRSFHRTVGCSPIDYHLRLRISRAADLLVNTRLSISQTAEAVGFNDSNYFSRQFRKRTGLSPRAYRKTH